MSLVWALLAVIVLLGFLVQRLSQVYQNPQKVHTSTPARFEIPYEEVRFPTGNGCRLYGWWIPAPESSNSNGSTQILVHGWGRNLERMLDYIQALHPRGHHLLAFDSRHHGSSDQDGYSSMLKFAEDIQAAVDFVTRQEGVDPQRVGVVGLSIGGSGALYAAARDARLSTVITVGAFAHPAGIMRREFSKKRIPYFPLVWLVFQYFQLRIGARLDHIAPVNNIHRAAARILLIHGREDATVPAEEARQLLAAGDPALVRLWEIPGKSHSDCHQHPRFWEAVSAFLDGSNRF